MAARDLLQLGPGAVVTLDRQVGEPVDLILNGVRFATGHLVVVGDQLGIRIKDILASPAPPAAPA
jgi:flagellar motor switch protein FliN/FliY